MSLVTIVGSIELGLIFAILALGLYIAFRILDLPDLTVDGSFVTGVAYSSIWTVAGQPITGLFMAALAGMAAGIVTGIFHTKLKIHAILAGILTMTGLYSINLMILKKPSVFFYGEDTIFTPFSGKLIVAGVSFSKTAFLLGMVSIIVIAIHIFLKTQIGLSLRATGDNEAMVRSSSINTDTMKILGFAICNLIVAFSGAVYAQYISAGNNDVGAGMLVLGLASIILGEVIVGRKGILRQLIAAVVGAIVYRLLLAFAFQLGLPAETLKLFSASIVAIAISIPLLKPAYQKWRKRYARNQ